MIEMPILRPVPTPLEIAAAEGRKLGFWERVKAWWETNRKWEVMEDWNLGRYAVSEGFVFDGASIPRPLWWFLSPIGTLLIPGLIHDFAYRYNVDDLDRDEYDEIFRVIIKRVTGTTILPWIAWAAVRLGGWKAWKKHRKND